MAKRLTSMTINTDLIDKCDKDAVKQKRSRSFIVEQILDKHYNSKKLNHE